LAVDVDGDEVAAGGAVDVDDCLVELIASAKIRRWLMSNNVEAIADTHGRIAHAAAVVHGASIAPGDAQHLSMTTLSDSRLISINPPLIRHDSRTGVDHSRDRDESLRCGPNRLQHMLQSPAKTLIQIWDICRPDRVPASASRLEHDRTRQAFCAGALLTLLTAVAARSDQTAATKKALIELANAIRGASGEHRAEARVPDATCSPPS